MTKWLIRIFAPIVIAALLVVVIATTHAQMRHERSPRDPSEKPEVAANTKVPRCSTATIAGAWVFTANNLYLQDGTLDGNAMGTANYHVDGTLDGTYDWEGTGGFYPGIAYAGTLSVNPDCTGTISFHDVGDTYVVVQSIVIARSGQEIWGMFQNPADDVGTFKLTRITEPRDGAVRRHCLS
jgi:hypothetical protein